MRVSGWFVGILALTMLVIGTGICAIVSYNGVRTFVIDSWDNGLQVDDPGDIVAALTNPESILQPTNTPVDTNNVIVMPSITPVATLSVATEVAVDTTPEPTGIDVSGQTAQATETPQPTLDPAAEYQLNDPRQIRILLMGIDERAGFTTENAYRTDTMIVLNIDPVRNTAGVISFPRDLWVAIPNFEPARINTANYIGDNVAYPGGGGPQLAKETIAANFGIDIDHYVRINFTVFETVVDVVAPNGVEVCPTERIYDDHYPDEGFGTIIVEFLPGCQRLDGEKLLQYARTRSTDGSDFDRAKRQQEVIDAVRVEVLSLGGMANLISQVPVLWSELSDSFDTDLTIEQVIALGFKLNEIPRENIQYAVIDNNYVTFGQTPQGDQILHPNLGRISDLIRRVLYPQLEVDQADLLTRAEAESADVHIYNGTDIAGLAGRTQEWFIGRGISIASVGNAPDHNSAPTVIRYYGETLDTANYIADVMGLSAERIQPGSDGLLVAGNVAVIIGPDVQSLLAGN
ncbi:MAG: LCP family protein [Anaerolineae bacterium]|nr:LCP family protein [Anaerolineae bacterium]